MRDLDTSNACKHFRQYILLSFLIVLTSFVSVSAHTKRALVIGISTYEDKEWGTINGGQDVKYVKEILLSAGFRQIQTLVDKQATKKRIVSAFRSLTESCCGGDIVYIHFSGHGQQMTDLDGDEKNDGLDEAWIPYDAHRKFGAEDKGEKHLSDDELNGLLSAIRKKVGNQGKILVVVDACHSGSSTRGIDDEVIRGVFEPFVIPMRTRKVRRTSLRESWTLLSACKDYQINAEMQKPKAGKLTYGLYTILKERKATDNVTLMDCLTTFMSRNGLRLQTPELSGQVDTSIIQILR